MLKNCLIYDFSTLSTDPVKGVVTTMAFTPFKIGEFRNCRYTREGLEKTTRFFKFSVNDQRQNHKRKICPKTVDFWKEMSPKLRDTLLKPHAKDLPMKAIPKIFEKFVDFSDISYVFTRSNNFDPFFLKCIYKDLGYDEMPFEHWKQCDVASYIRALAYGYDISDNFLPETGYGKTFQPQHPVQSVVTDILRIQEIAIELESDDVEEVPF